jgi:hypothetical protein
MSSGRRARELWRSSHTHQVHGLPERLSSSAIRHRPPPRRLRYSVQPRRRTLSAAFQGALPAPPLVSARIRQVTYPHRSMAPTGSHWSRESRLLVLVLEVGQGLLLFALAMLHPVIVSHPCRWCRGFARPMATAWRELCAVATDDPGFGATFNEPTATAWRELCAVATGDK